MGRLLAIRIWIILIATAIGIASAILAYSLPDHAILVLSVEIILLPAIYIIGNYIAEQIIEIDYSEDMDSLNEMTLELNEKYIKLNEKYKLLKKHRNKHG